ncbi:MAG TPA: metal/formaldehyde-sensitive transcriptional repressor [Candidatus Bathyarchaeia archaeon]|nr:metal/formaldehyde-sensitive transcriptional repressor [Candidatus Bathyarchaeia archaeon]
MSHVSNNPKLLTRVRRIKGQIESLENAVVEGQDCYKVLQQTAAVRGALNGLMAQLIESHLRFHTLERKHARHSPEHEIQEVMTVIRSYLS